MRSFSLALIKREYQTINIAAKQRPDFPCEIFFNLCHTQLMRQFRHLTQSALE
jgi:hypothetical protein